MKCNLDYRLVLSFVLLILTFFVSIYGIYLIPNDVVVTHWNVYGEADGFLPKVEGLLLPPIIMGFILILLVFLPKFDPLRKNYTQFFGSYYFLILFFSLIFFVINIFVVLWNLGFEIPINFVILPMVAVLFFVIGFLMKDFKKNWFVGIKTPWTLSNDLVWKKTHQMGSKVFYVMGLAFLLGAFQPNAFVIILAVVFGGIIFLFAYSYWVFRKIENKK